MQVSSSITTTAPDPNMEPAFATESKSKGVSSWLAVSTGVDDPPGITAFTFLPFQHPPPTFSLSRRSGKPMGNSYTRGLFTCPVNKNKRVPPCFGGLIEGYPSPPCRRIAGTDESVSTLLITVGQPYSPTTAGKGGRIRGEPRFPSSDSIS